MTVAADLWLPLLWVQCGHSWTHLEARLRRALGARDKLRALRRLRARAGTGRAAGAPSLPAGAGLADLEDALRWLTDPAAASPLPPPTDAAMAALATPALMRRLAGGSPWMPRREMEEILRRGPRMVPALVELLGDDPAPPRADPLWVVVCLGELRHPAAVPALDGLLAHPDGDVAVAAAEALVKVGTSAVATLAARTRDDRPGVRRLACGALGRIADADARRYLRAAGRRDPTLADTIAVATAPRRRAAALARLRARPASDPLRPGLEAGVRAVMRGFAAPAVVDDWRLRYRRLPRLGWSIPPSPLALAARVQSRLLARDPGHAPAALADALDAGRSRPHALCCAGCGGRIWQPTGLPLCRHTAAAVLQLQRAALARWLDAGVVDVWVALDDCDLADARAGGAPPRIATAGPDAIAIARATLYWVASLQRAEPRMDLRTGSEQLTLLAGDLARLYDRTADAHPRSFPNQ